jgi:predicted lipoprotein
MNLRERRFPVALTLWVTALLLACAIFPPFHIRRIDTDTAQDAAREPFNAGSVATTFWTERLIPAADRATDAAVLLKASSSDSATAAQQYGRRTGLGGSDLYFLRGEAKVATIDRKGVWLATQSAANVRMVLLTGPVFGNALRDCTGLLDLKDYSSFDFNALSSELNRLAETRVQPVLRERAVIGATVQFVGCAEDGGISDESRVLRVVPIKVAFP